MSKPKCGIMIEFPYDFLDNKAYLLVADIRRKHPKQYNIVFSIAELMRRIMKDEDCRRFSGDREKYIVCTVYDCYVTYSSEIILLERGLVSEFFVILRTFYEKKFKLFAVIRNKKNYNKVIDEQESRSISFAKRILENKNHMFDLFVEKIEDVRYDFYTFENNKKSVKSWATDAKLESEYEILYSLLSFKTHYSINTLAEKIEHDNDGNVTFLSYSYDNFDEHLITASMEMLVCIDRYLQFSNCKKYQDVIEKIDKQIKEIVKQIEDRNKK